MTDKPLAPEEERSLRSIESWTSGVAMSRIWATLDAARARIAELERLGPRTVAASIVDSQNALIDAYKRERDEARAENDKHFKAWYEAEREIKRVRAECERLTGLITSLRGAQGSMDAAEGK